MLRIRFLFSSRPDQQQKRASGAAEARREQALTTAPMMSGVMPEMDVDGEEEVELEQDDDGDEVDDDEEEDEYADHAHAALSCRASRQRRTSLANNETLSALSANDGKLNGNVCSLLQCSDYQVAPLPAHLRSASSHSYWRALLHTGGFSLLFHGFGCKRALLRSVVAPLAHNGKILSINGCSSKSALRELLVKICEQDFCMRHIATLIGRSQVLQINVPAGSNSALVAHIRRAFSMSAKRASPADKLQSAPHGGGGVYRNVLRLLATRECESEEEADNEYKEMPTVSSQRTSSRLQRIYDEQRLGEIAMSDDVCAASVKSRSRCSDQVVPRMLYIVVHNIDGVALRSETAQSLLAALAALPQVKLVASCSHRNAAAVWDGQQARQFNWAWIQADTAAPYVNEARESVHDLLGRLQDETECSEGRSAQIVLSALTTNARRVFSELLAHSLEEPASAGLAFSALYHRVKSKLICTSEAALNGHITEFVDHHLVRTRRSDSGRQCFYATLPKSVAKQIVEQAIAK